MLVQTRAILELLTNGDNCRNVHQSQPSPANLQNQTSKIEVSLLVENSLCVGLPGCKRSPSLGCLARKWRQKILSKKWNIFRRPWHKSHQIRRLQFQRYIQPSFQTYEGPLHLSVMDRFSVCGSVIRNDAFQRRTCWQEEPQRVRQVGWYPQESHLRVVLPSIGTRNVWSCARDVKSIYLQIPIWIVLHVHISIV